MSKGGGPPPLFCVGNKEERKWDWGVFTKCTPGKSDMAAKIFVLYEFRVAFNQTRPWEFS